MTHMSMGAKTFSEMGSAKMEKCYYTTEAMENPSLIRKGVLYLKTYEMKREGKQT